jgi:hypothetical protein
MSERNQNERLVLSDTDTEKESENETQAHSKSGRPQSGVWKHFDRGESKGDGHWEGTCQYCKKFYPRAKPNYLRAHLANNCKNVPEEWRRHFNYILVNNLQDVSTDEPLNESNISLSQKWKVATNQLTVTNMDASTIDEAITLAFIMCGIPFRVIGNPFFMNALKTLNSCYEIPSREILSGRLLDTEVAKVNSKVDKIIEFTNDITIGLDGWTAPEGSSIWNFVLLTSSRQEYLYELGDYSNQSQTAEFLANQIESVVNRIGSQKILAIVSDNGVNIAFVRRLI